MELPIFIDGKRTGTLSLSQQGRFWRAEAQLGDLGRVARLSVYGRGGSVYLGIPEPDGRGAMRLSRTLRTLPEGAEYCAEREAGGMDTWGFVPQKTKAEYCAEREAGGARRETSAKEPEPEPPRAPKAEKTARHVVWMGGRPYYF